MDFKSIHIEAIQAARLATADYIAKNGEHPFNCGFAWVRSSEKGNTKLGKALKNLGFEKNWYNGYELWNPSGSFTQDMSAKYAGAEAYVNVFKKYIPDIKLYPSSRLD